MSMKVVLYTIHGLHVGGFIKMWSLLKPCIVVHKCHGEDKKNNIFQTKDTITDLENLRWNEVVNQSLI